MLITKLFLKLRRKVGAKRLLMSAFSPSVASENFPEERLKS